MPENEYTTTDNKVTIHVFGDEKKIKNDTMKGAE